MHVRDVCLRYIPREIRSSIDLLSGVIAVYRERDRPSRGAVSEMLPSWVQSVHSQHSTTTTNNYYN